MRVSATTMPPCSAMAPPLRPVPAPRATTGTPCFARRLDHAGDLFGRPRQHDDRRQRTVDRAVVLEYDQVLGLMDDVRPANDGGEVTDEVGVAHGLTAP